MVSWQVGVTLGQLVHNWRKVDCTIMAELSGLCFQIRMAKSPETVSKFLTGLAEKLQPLWKVEKEELLKLKEDEVLA